MKTQSKKKILFHVRLLTVLFATTLLLDLSALADCPEKIPDYVSKRDPIAAQLKISSDSGPGCVLVPDSKKKEFKEVCSLHSVIIAAAGKITVGPNAPCRSTPKLPEGSPLLRDFTDVTDAILKDKRYKKFTDSELNANAALIMDRLKKDVEEGGASQTNIVKLLLDDQELDAGGSDALRKKVNSYAQSIAKWGAEAIAGGATGTAGDLVTNLGERGVKAVAKRTQLLRPSTDEKTFSLSELSPPKSRVIQGTYVASGTAQIALGLTAIAVTGTPAAPAAGFITAGAGAAAAAGAAGVRAYAEGSRGRHGTLTANGLEGGGGSGSRMAGTAAGIATLGSKGVDFGLKQAVSAITPEVGNLVARSGVDALQSGAVSLIPNAGDAIPIAGGVLETMKGLNDLKKAAFGFEKGHELLRANEIVYREVVRNLHKKRQLEVRAALQIAARLMKDYDSLSADERAMLRDRFGNLCAADMELIKQTELMEKRYNSRINYLNQQIYSKNFRKRRREDLLAVIGKNFDKRQAQSLEKLENEVQSSNKAIHDQYTELRSQILAKARQEGREEEARKLLQVQDSGDLSLKNTLPLGRTAKETPKTLTTNEVRDFRLAELNQALSDSDLLEKRMKRLGQVTIALGFGDPDGAYAPDVEPTQAKAIIPGKSKTGKPGSPEVAISKLQETVEENRSRVNALAKDIKDELNFRSSTEAMKKHQKSK